MIFFNNMNTLEVLQTRRCVRSYKSEQIKNEELDAILEAGTYAPSARNQQPCTIVALQDKDLINEAGTVNPERGGVAQYYGAPTIVLVFADKTIPTRQLDASAITMNMMNAAHCIGVDSCWIHIPPNTYASEKGKELLKKLGLDDNFEGVSSITLGYTDSEYPEVKPRKDNFIKKF